MDINEKAAYLKIDNITNDINQIDYYSSEEHKIFGRIGKSFKSIKNGYSSPNSNVFNEVGTGVLNKREFINLKRNKYHEVLQHNVDRYKEATGLVIEIMSESGDSNE